jgi:hypothetical protein
MKPDLLAAIFAINHDVQITLNVVHRDELCRRKDTAIPAVVRAIWSEERAPAKGKK